MYYQNRRSWRYRQRPVPRIVFRVYALLWLLPVMFFLAAPTAAGLLVALCIAITIWLMMATWQKPKRVENARLTYQRHPPPLRESFPLARLKQPSLSRYEGGWQEEKSSRYDDYEQPQAKYPGQRP